jgi:serine/threonine protein kinase
MSYSSWRMQDPRGFMAKLSDFGLSMKMAAHDGQVPGIKYGTVQYLAPEVLNTHIMTKKADVFSFGIIMWEVWHSRLFAEFYNIEKKKRKACVLLFLLLALTAFLHSSSSVRPSS